MWITKKEYCGGINGFETTSWIYAMLEIVEFVVIHFVCCLNKNERKIFFYLSINIFTWVDIYSMISRGVRFFLLIFPIFLGKEKHTRCAPRWFSSFYHFITNRITAQMWKQYLNTKSKLWCKSIYTLKNFDFSEITNQVWWFTI